MISQIKASRVINHTCRPFHCSVSELIVRKEGTTYTPITVRFISSSRNDVTVEIYDEDSDEVFEETRTYALASDLPEATLAAVNIIPIASL